MSRGVARALFAVALATGVSGLCLLLFRQLLGEPSGDALVHRGEPEALAVHVLAAPWLLFVCGVVWTTHVAPRLRRWNQSRRHSGRLMVGLLVPMAVTGYSLQVLVDDAWRSAAGVAHGVIGALWVATFAVHLWPHRLPAHPGERRHRRPANLAPQ